MVIRAATGLDQLYDELRALAADAHAAVDAFAASWYLETRACTGVAFATWDDEAVGEVAAAVVFGADARPGCGHLGADRAVAGAGEVMVRDDVRALVRTAESDPTLPRRLEHDDLVEAALAGWEAALLVSTRDLAVAAPDRPRESLRHALEQAVASGGAPVPIAIVVDVPPYRSSPSAARVVGDVIGRVAEAHRGTLTHGWFEFAGGSRHVALARRTRDAARHVAALRGALRVAPGLAGDPAHVWMEAVPRSASALPAFMNVVAGVPETPETPVARPHRRKTAPPRAHEAHRAGRGRSPARHPRWQFAPERWLASATLLLLMVFAVGTLTVEPVVDDLPAPGVAGDQAAPGTSGATALEWLPPSGGATGVPADLAAQPASSGADASAAPQVNLDATPIALVEPVVPDTHEASGASDEPPPAVAVPEASPQEPEPPAAPVPPGPPSASLGDPAPGPPAHALAKAPGHVSARHGGPASVRGLGAGITRL